MSSDLLSWEQLYKEQPVETMPWYYPDLDFDFKRTLAGYGIGSGFVLDLGTGPGTQAMALANMGFKVAAIDISKTAVKKAAKKARSLGLTIDFRQDDIIDSKLDGKFDIIFDRGCFHTVSPRNRQKYVKNVFRLLKPNGLLLLKCFSYKEKDDEGPYRFTPKSIEKCFKSYFSIVSVTDSYFEGLRQPLPKALFCIMKKL